MRLCQKAESREFLDMRMALKGILVVLLISSLALVGTLVHEHFELQSSEIVIPPHNDQSDNKPDDHGYVWQSYEYYLERLSQLEQMPLHAGDVVFVGDSITEGCDWGKLFQNPDVRNFGISGDSTRGLLNRLDMITQAKPGKMFLMIGINDLNIRGAQSITAILHDYRKILLRVIEESPETRIYVQSVLPVNKTIFKCLFNNQDVLTLDAGLREMSNELGVGYVDLYPRFVKDGQLNKIYTSDGIHLNGDGYNVWKGMVEGLVRYADDWWSMGLLLVQPGR
jgi:lysophospholipase L1-like esterase